MGSDTGEKDITLQRFLNIIQERTITRILLDNIDISTTISNISEQLHIHLIPAVTRHDK